MELGMTVDSMPGAGYQHGYRPRITSSGSGSLSQGMHSPSQGMGGFQPEAYLEPAHQNNNTIPSLQRKKTGPGGRILEQHDSGVADVHLEGYRPSHLSSSPSTPSPRGMNGFVLPQPSPQHTHSPHKAHRPDSLAYTNEYEELPSAKYLDPNGKYSYANADELPPGLFPPSLHRSNPVDTSTENLCRGSTPERAPNTYRKRQNPLYEDTNFGHSTGLKNSDEKLEPKRPDCFCPILIVVGILAFLTFLLVILLITKTLPGSNQNEPEFALVVTHPNQSNLLAALEKLEALQAQYDDLLQKYERLETIVGPMENFNDTSIDRGLINSLQLKVDQLENQTGIYQSDLEELRLGQTNSESRFSSKIANMVIEVNNLEQETNDKISTLTQSVGQQVAALDGKLHSVELRSNNTLTAYRTEVFSELSRVNQIQGPAGPQGPPGVGNLSVCEAKSLRSGGSSAFETTETKWVPSDASNTNYIIQNWVIMAATCSVEGGAIARLSVQNHPTDDVKQYRCECEGQIEGRIERYCTMYYWICPQTS